MKADSNTQVHTAVEDGLISWPGDCYWGAQAVQRAVRAAGEKLRRPLVITDAPVWQATAPAITHVLQTAHCDWQVYDGVVPNPALQQVRAALETARRLNSDSIIAVGGGSAIDVAKVVLACLAGKLQADDLATPQGQAWLTAPGSPHDPLFLAVPTTSGTGSESSSAALIQRDDGAKHLYRSLRTRPALVALQPALTLTLPFRATVQGGFDAVLHALGAWINTDPNPAGKAMALRALALCLRALPAVLAEPDSLPARADMQMGAYLAGVAIGISKVDAVHAMCTPLESQVHMAHAEVLAPVFRVVARYTAQTHPAPYAAAARQLGIAASGDDHEDARALIERIESLAQRAKLATHFADLSLTQAQAQDLAVRAMQSASMPINPRQLTLDETRALYLQMITPH